MLPGCTDRRAPKITPREVQYAPQQILQNVAEVQFQESDTITLNMVTSGGSIYLTGRPFGFAKWDVSADPENPHLTFSASDRIDQFSPDPPFGGWVVDYFASGAIGLFQNFAFTSGTAGLSVIDMRNSNFPVEVERYPRGDNAQDIAYVYKAIVRHPTRPLLYGFSEQDYLYTLDVSAAPQARLLTKGAYSNAGPVCCVHGATVMNDKVYVAMRSRLRVFSFAADGSLAFVSDSTLLNPVNVVSTSRFLYVQHSPVGSGYNRKPAGIYVFTPAGEQVAYLPVNPLVFAVSPQDSHLYTNEDDVTVQIYRIRWTN